MAPSWLTTWRLTLEFEGAGRFDKAPESILKGAVGLAMLDTVCPYVQDDGREPPCAGCPAQLECAYPNLFKPAALEGGSATPPPAFSLVYQGPSDPSRGDTARIDLTMVGHGRSGRDAFFQALQHALARGVGSGGHRARGRVIDIVERPPPSPPPGAMDRVTVALDTPLVIREWQGESRRELQHFDGVAFTRAVRRRLDSLIAHYGHPGVDLPLVDELVVSAQDTRLDTRRAYSRRQDRALYARGLVGRVQLAGDVAPWMEALALCSRLGVGRMTSWGNGQISLEASGTYSPIP